MNSMEWSDMPRIRTIKPDFFDDEELAALPLHVRYVFPGLWCYADRKGKLEDRPKFLKSKLYPYDDYDMAEIITALATHRKENGEPFITRYEVGGRRYIKINGFLKHQRPHHTETESALPDPDGAPIEDIETAAPPREKRPEKNGAEHQAIIDHIHQTFKSKKGSPYPFSGADFKTVKFLLGLYGLYQLMAMWDVFLACDDEWIKKVGHKITEFRRQVPMLLDKNDWKTLQKKYEKQGSEKVPHIQFGSVPRAPDMQQKKLESIAKMEGINV